MGLEADMVLLALGFLGPEGPLLKCLVSSLNVATTRQPTELRIVMLTAPRTPKSSQLVTAVVVNHWLFGVFMKAVRQPVPSTPSHGLKEALVTGDLYDIAGCAFHRVSFRDFGASSQPAAVTLTHCLCYRFGSNFAWVVLCEVFIGRRCNGRW